MSNRLENVCDDIVNLHDWSTNIAVTDEMVVNIKLAVKNYERNTLYATTDELCKKLDNSCIFMEVADTYKFIMEDFTAQDVKNKGYFVNRRISQSM
jgi:hypothetical protein